MIKRIFLLGTAVLLAAGCATDPALPAEQFRVHRVFGDHMVLQAGCDLRISGQAEPGRRVEVRLQPETGGEPATAMAVADERGNWEAVLPPREPSFTPHRLTVHGAPTVPPLEFRDLLIGEVWLCSGQSNMEFGLRGAEGGEKAIADAEQDRGRIRLLNLNSRKVLAPEGPRSEIEDVHWTECTPETVKNFSAVAYFFGHELARRLDRPIGLIHSSWGGSRIEAWISRDQLLRDGIETELLIQAQATGLTPAQEQALDQLRAQCDETYHRWWQQLFRAHAAETAAAATWKNPDFDDHAWETAPVPGTLPGHLDGAVWYRRTVELPPEWAGSDLQLALGRIDDCDETYFNGEKLGGAMPDHPAPWAVDRRYRVPARLVRPGRNVIAVRVVDLNGAGGFFARPEELYLARGDQKLPLAGADWRRHTEFALGRDEPGRPPLAGDLVKSLRDPNFPSTLFNGMLHPLTVLDLAGVIWYQGESNVGARSCYPERTASLLRDWRRRWRNPELPFIFTQLAGYDSRASDDPASPVYWRKLPPEESDWAEFRDLQTSCLKLPGTGMAVTYDLGNCTDIHPRNKRTVGERLAAEAARVAYGDDRISSGPAPEKVTVQGDRVRIRFARVGSGLVARGDQPGGFALAGADGKWVWAQAVIDGDEVVVRTPEVPQPVAVRYAWSSYPGTADLYNREGFPALPFQAQARNAR